MKNFGMFFLFFFRYKYLSGWEHKGLQTCDILACKFKSISHESNDIQLSQSIRPSFFFRFDGQFINFSDASNLEHKSVLASLWVNLTSLRLLEQIN